MKPAYQNSHPRFLKTSVSLRQPVFWSRAILWAIVGVTTATLLWAMFAQMEEVVSAAGKLEPAGNVRQLQAPVSGVVQAVHVQDGQRVHAGETLIRLEPKVTEAQVSSLESVRDSLRQEIEFYTQQMADNSVTVKRPQASLPAESLALARDRASLVADNRLLQAQVNHSADGLELAPAQRQLFEAAEKNRLADIKQAQLTKEQAEQQLASNQTQLVQAEKLQANNQEIVDSNQKLLKSGSIARQDFLAHEAELIRSKNEVEKLRSNIANLQIQIAKARDEIDAVNTRALKEALAAQEKNNQQIAEIDARLSKSIVANRQRIAEIESQLTQQRTSLGYHDIAAPVDGIVFDLGPKQIGAVVAASDVLLKIVPDDELLAKVNLTNRDIGFVREGLPADIRVDSFPYREFGDIPGVLTFIGSDAMPPTQSVPFYSFPAKIKMARQSLQIRGQPVKLQSGMSVSVNIKLRKRSVMSLFIDFLLSPVDKLEEVR